MVVARSTEVITGAYAAIVMQILKDKQEVEKKV
jgi:hypothetical protein